jgi:hypothetical protein
MPEDDFDASVVFGMEIEIPRYLSRFIKRLIHFQPTSSNTLFAIAASTAKENGTLTILKSPYEGIIEKALAVTRKPGDNNILLSSRNNIKTQSDSQDNESDDGEEEFDEEEDFSEISETDMDEVRHSLLEELIQTIKGRKHYYFPYYSDNNRKNYDCYRYDLVSKAFDLAASRLLGEDHHMELVRYEYNN